MSETIRDNWDIMDAGSFNVHVLLRLCEAYMMTSDAFKHPEALHAAARVCVWLRKQTHDPLIMVWSMYTWSVCITCSSYNVATVVL